MKCPNCGKESSGNFCDSCGTLLNQKDTQEQNRQTQEQNQGQSSNQQYSGSFVPHKPKKSVLKQWWFWVIIVVAIAIIGSAFAKNGSTTTKETYKINETAELKEIKVTADEIKESSGSMFFKPADGKTFVNVKFTIENISDNEQIISSILLFEAYADDVKCDYSVSAMVGVEGTLDGNLASGKKLTGWYAVEIPNNWKKLELKVKSSWQSSSKATFVFDK